MSFNLKPNQVYLSSYYVIASSNSSKACCNTIFFIVQSVFLFFSSPHQNQFQLPDLHPLSELWQPFLVSRGIQHLHSDNQLAGQAMFCKHWPIPQNPKPNCHHPALLLKCRRHRMFRNGYHICVQKKFTLLREHECR